MGFPFETHSSAADTAWGDTMTGISRNNSSMMAEDITELQMIGASERYYIILPKRYFILRGIRVMLLFLVCILFCRSYFFIGVPPGFIIAFMQFSKFCKFMRNVNISVKKLRFCLAVWILVCIGINIAFWNLIMTVW